MKHADVPVEVLLREIFGDTGLVAKSDTSEELDHLLLLVGERTSKNSVCFLINKLGCEFELIGQVV